MFKKLLKKLTGKEDTKKSPKRKTNKKKTAAKKGAKAKTTKTKFENRFQKFYHLNKTRLNKERRGSYKTKAKKGKCVRCKLKAKPGIVFCDYHQKKQKDYNAKARKKRKKGKK